MQCGSWHRHTGVFDINTQMEFGCVPQVVSDSWGVQNRSWGLFGDSVVGVG